MMKRAQGFDDKIIDIGGSSLLHIASLFKIVADFIHCKCESKTRIASCLRVVWDEGALDSGWHIFMRPFGSQTILGELY